MNDARTTKVVVINLLFQKTISIKHPNIVGSSWDFCKAHNPIARLNDRWQLTKEGQKVRRSFRSNTFQKIQTCSPYRRRGWFSCFWLLFFLMWFSNLPFFYMIIYMVYLLALQKVSPSHPTKISKGNTFSPLKDTTLRRTLGHTKARVPDLLSVNDNAMLDACATATRAFDTQDDSHGDAGTLIVFGAPTYLGLFCHFFIHFLNRWHQVWSKWLKLRVLLSGAGVLSHWSDGRAKVLWISLSLSLFLWMYPYIIYCLKEVVQCIQKYYII